MFVPGKLFQPSLMFKSRIGAYQSEANEGFPVVSLTNFKLGWKAMPGTNTLTYYKHSQITAAKSFIRLAPGACTIKLFTAVIYGFT